MIREQRTIRSWFQWCLVVTLFALSLHSFSSTAQAYYTSQVFNFTKPGETITFNFANLPAASGDISVTVYLYGDYDSITEYATVYLDGSYKGRIQGGDKQCSTNLSKNKVLYKHSASSVSDGKLEVRVRNSISVSASCGTNRVMVVIAYTANAPDFSIRTFSLSSTKLKRGSRVTATYQIQNLGKRSGIGYVRIYLSPDYGITNKDIYLNHQRTVLLAAGKSSSTYKVSVLIPANAPGSKNFIGIFVDYDNKVKEDNEFNNTRVVAVTIDVPGPDLSVTGALLSPTSLTTSGSFTIRISLKNNGTTGILTDFEVKYYYCTAFDLKTCTTLLKSQTITNNFKAGSSYSYTTPSMKLPKSVQAGVRALRIQVDSTKRIKESNELNNDFLRYAAVSENRPDLSLQSFSVSPTKLPAGKQITVRYSIRNSGLSDTKLFTTKLYLSRNSTITTSDLYLKHSRLLAVKKGTTTSIISVTVTIPSSEKAGTVYIGAIADDTNSINETNETNNVRSARITLTELPDLRLDKLQLSTTQLKAGQSFTVLLQVSNASSSTAPATNVGLYLSTSSTVTPKSTLLKSWRLNSLGAGKSQTITDKVSLPSFFSGTQLRLGAFVDPNNDIKEKSESNNSKQLLALLLRDDDKDGSWSYPGCPSSVKHCDCNDRDKNIRPGARELCDGKDNDCDGAIDEGCQCLNGSRRTCGISTGECRQGTQTCREGRWGSCSGDRGPTLEVCDGKDNDCDGKTDEGEVCKEPSKEPSPEPHKESTSEPSKEPIHDTGTEPIADASTEPVPEVTQEKKGCKQQECAAGSFCRNGVCVVACGCQTCPAGQRCIDGICQQDLCTLVQCLDDEICTANGKCIGDPCIGVSCSAGEVCQMGVCAPPACATISCPDGMRCQQGQCVGIVCKGGEVVVEKNASEPNGDAGPPPSPDASTTVDSPRKEQGCVCQSQNLSSFSLWSFCLLALLLLVRRRFSTSG
jgi:subtilase family serine protease